MAKRKVFKKRTAENEDKIMRQFCDSGPDTEDVEMLKQALKRLKEKKDELADGVRWAYYPSVPLDPEPSKKRKLSDGKHVTGSARTEGYYKIDKKAYLNANQPTYTLSSTSSNNKLTRKKQLKYSRSRIHGWGLFAMENIAADEMVIEYVGEVIRSSVADEREKRYEAAGIRSSYLFRIDEDYVIDATKKGNVARFINHCCDPNCYAKVINLAFKKKIVIYAKRDIKANEEITYDYKFPIEEVKIPCFCGAQNCRGTLN